MSRGFASNYRIVLLATVLLASFAGIGFRLVDLHVINRDALLPAVEVAREQTIVEEARRGDILDVRGNLLATSRPQVKVWVDPSYLRPEDESKWPRLAELIGRPLPEVEAILRRTTRTVRSDPVAPSPEESPVVLSGGPESATQTRAARTVTIQYAVLADEVDESAYAEIQKLGIRGVGGEHVYRRIYPQDGLAAHVIGFVNGQGDPAAGVEAFADFYLRGQDGWREGERDGRRREMPQFRTREVAPSDGYNVVLSLDSAIQFMVEEALARIDREFHPAGASIIVSDARTGFVLGMGNVPSFNLNEYGAAAADDLSVLRNIAITNQIDPGSTFKIVAASGAINEGLVTRSTLFDCSLQTIDYKGRTRRFMPDDHTWTHPLTVAEIVSHSSNVGAAQLGMLLQERKLYDYARAFGFGERTGFPFGGEISGVLNPPERWSDLESTRIPAGYSVSATPLQIHYAMGVIASGGVLLQPQIIREIRDADGKLVQRFDTRVKRRVISEQTAATMADMLMGVAGPDGTAPEAAILNYQVAGKTGTAQKLIDGRYSERNHVGSFVGFFPASRPEVVISVIVDDGHPPGGRVAYGRTVAVPAFHEIAEKLIPYLGIAPVPGTSRLQIASQEAAR